MKKHLSHLIISGAVVAMVAGCGGGSSDNHDTSTTADPLYIGGKTVSSESGPDKVYYGGHSVNTAAGNSSSSNNTGNNTDNSSTTPNITGWYTIFNATAPPAFQETDPNTDINKLKINSNTIIDIQKGSNVHSLSHSVYGALKDNGKIYFFAQGMATPDADIPKTGKASYIGLAEWIETSSSSTKLVSGNSSTAADFDHKNFTTKINQGTTNVFTFDGNISGNEFSRVTTDTTVKGKFFGEKAAETAGSFNTEKAGKSYIGTFGGVKQ